MGADLTLAMCERSVPFDTAQKRLTTLDNKKVGVLFFGWDTNPDDNDDTDYVSVLADDLSVCYDDRRDTASVLLRGVTWVITGGMSWGEEPTDAFCSIDRIDQLGITLGDEEWEVKKKEWEKEQ